MKKLINGKEIKITKAGFLYIDGVKSSELRVTPLNTHNLPQEYMGLYQEYNKKNYVMS